MIGFLSAEICRWKVVQGKGGVKRLLWSVKKDMKECELKKEDAQNRPLWRRSIVGNV